MKQTTKKSILKVFLVIFILGFFHWQGIARFIVNKSEMGYEEPGRTGIHQYVIEAAGGFLKSQSDFLLFLNKIEMEEINGIDFAELRRIINDAVVHMENARAKYKDLTQLADITPYDQPTITGLMGFNYTLLKDSKKMNRVIFNEVMTYLSSGDVRGLYHQLLADTQSIQDQLILIKYDVDAEVIPGTSGLWQVNQSYSETLIFGQYAAEVFYDVTGN